MSTSFWLSSLDAEAKARLRQAKTKIPRKLPKGRALTAADLCIALKALPATYSVEFKPVAPKPGENWCIDVTTKRKRKSGPWTFFNIAFAGMKKPLPLIHFEAGHPETVGAIAIELAKLTGPLVLDGEDIYGPHLITAEVLLADLVDAMEGRASKELKGLNKWMAEFKAMSREEQKAYRKELRDRSKVVWDGKKFVGQTTKAGKKILARKRRKTNG